MVVGFTTTSEITTNVENLNLSHGEVYSIQHYVIKCVSDLRQVGGFHQVHQSICPPRYNRNIVENGVKHHNPFLTALF